MKKLIVGMIAAALMTTGLVAAGQTAATAAPYPGTVATSTQAAGVTTRAPRAKVFVKVTSPEGRPSGRLTFTFVRAKGGTTYTFGRSYQKKASTYTFGGLKPGRYTVLVSFVPPESSKYKPSNGKARVWVKRK